MIYVDNSVIDFQIHGYRNGHQLLSSTINLNGVDQDTIDRLSDISGSIRPGEIFSPYFTCYPVPSKTYYVVARTWQDLTVRRAGCVVTKSIIIDIDHWKDSDDLSVYFDILLQSNDDKSNVMPPSYNLNYHPSKVFDFRTIEITEALFLEQGLPILAFNVDEALDISIRILSVFWPSKRKEFSLCTYALSPRTIKGSSFDLLFAPTSSKSKFSEWRGRRIESSLSQQKHRWSIELSENIFRSEIPHLINNDEVSQIFTKNHIGDFNLVLNLLWNELFEKASQDEPYLAVLGLLDIVNNEGENPEVLYQSVYPLIVRSVDLALKKLETKDAWPFFTSLLVRYKTKFLNRETLNIIRSGLSKLSETDPQGAIDYITTYKNPRHAIPPVFLAGVGDGVGNLILIKENDAQLHTLLDDIDGKLGNSFAAVSPQFANAIAEKYSSPPHPVSALLQRIIAAKNDVKSVRSLANIAAGININSDPRLLMMVLDNASPQLYLNIIKNFSTKGILAAPKFNNSIIGYPRFQEFSVELFKYLLTDKIVFENPELVSNIVRIEPDLVVDLINSNISENCQILIINYIYESPTPGNLKCLRDHNNLGYILYKKFNAHLSNAARFNILFNGNFDLDTALIEISKIDSTGFKHLKYSFIEPFLQRSFTQASLKVNGHLSEILDKVKNIEAKKLFTTAIFSDISDARKFSNVEILIERTAFRTLMIQNVDYISFFLSRYLLVNPNREFLKSWSKLFVESHRNKQKQKEASIHILEFCFSVKNVDPTILIKVAFPILYRTLLKGKTVANRIKFAIFPDWDKCRTLRMELVDHYLYNNWSEVGLLEVANNSEILKEVLKLLADTKKGRKFLEQALRSQQGKSNKFTKELLKYIH